MANNFVDIQVKDINQGGHPGIFYLKYFLPKVCVCDIADCLTKYIQLTIYYTHYILFTHCIIKSNKEVSLYRQSLRNACGTIAREV